MKISNQTLSILKNFSTINPGILIKPGNEIATRTTAVYAKAVVEEVFPVEIGLAHLGNFLNVVSLFESPEFDFEPDFLRISESDGKAETLYGYAGNGMVQLSTKRKDLPTPSEIIEFSLSEAQLATLSKAVSVLQKSEIKLTSDGKTVRIGTGDTKQPTSNSYSLVVDADTHGFTCNMVFNYEHLKLMKGSYNGVLNKMYMQFAHTTLPLSYTIAPEPTTNRFE